MTTRITSDAVRTSWSPATAAKVMTPNPKSINRHATVRETAEILHEHGLHIAPVIDDAGRPIGVVSRTDLLDYWGRRRDRLTALAAGELNVPSAQGPQEPGDELDGARDYDASCVRRTDERSDRKRCGENDCIGSSLSLRHGC